MYSTSYLVIFCLNILIAIKIKMNIGIAEKVDFKKWECFKKWTLKNIFPHFTGYSTKIVPEQYGFHIVRCFLSPKNQYSPVYLNLFF